jgi:ketosteroid isomerase-like protein
VIDAWAQGLAAKNTAAVIAQLASNVVQFDLAPPLRVIDADPEGLESWFATWRDAIGYEISDLYVTVGAGVAFCYGLVHLTGGRTDGSDLSVSHLSLGLLHASHARRNRRRQIDVRPCIIFSRLSSIASPKVLTRKRFEKAWPRLSPRSIRCLPVRVAKRPGD